VNDSLFGLGGDGSLDGQAAPTPSTAGRTPTSA